MLGCCWNKKISLIVQKHVWLKWGEGRFEELWYANTKNVIIEDNIEVIIEDKHLTNYQMFTSKFWDVSFRMLSVETIVYVNLELQKVPALLE
jgi:hypothetical protein